MTLLEKKKKQRLELLKLIYEHADGRTDQIVNLYDIGDELGWDRSTVEAVFNYLEDEGLTIFRASGGCVAIEHYGVTEIEYALENPEEKTTYFPPVIQIINVRGDVVAGDTVTGDKVGGNKS